MAAARGDPGLRRPGPIFTVQSARPATARRDGLNTANNSRYIRDSPRSKVILTNDRITSTFSKNNIKKSSSSGFSADNSTDLLNEVTVDTPLTASYKEIVNNDASPNNQVSLKFTLLIIIIRSCQLGLQIYFERV